MQEKQVENKKIKILYIITKSNFGGAQKYVYELATSAPKEKFEVVVALGGNGILKDKLESGEIRTIQIPNLENRISLTKDLQVLAYLLRIIKIEKPDIIHLNSSKIGVVGSFAGLLSKTKTIFTAHAWAFNENRSAISKFIFKIIYWKTILLSNKTIAVSNKTKDQVSKWPFVKNKITVIHNGVKEIKFFEKEESRNRLKINRADIVLGTLSELHHIKGLDILIRAMKSLVEINPNIKLIVFGEGEERKKLEKLISKYTLEENIILLGFVKDAARYLKALDVFVLASRSEALSIAILEAGLANLPVVATKVGGIPEIITDKENGLLVEKENPEELINAILELIKNKTERERLSNSLNKKVIEEFSFDKNTSNKTYNLYFDLLRNTS